VLQSRPRQNEEPSRTGLAAYLQLDNPAAKWCSIPPAFSMDFIQMEDELILMMINLMTMMKL